MGLANAVTAAKVVDQAPDASIGFARCIRQEDTKIELEALRLRFAHQRAAIARRAAASVTL